MRVPLFRWLGSAAIFLASNALATMHYVDLKSTNPTPPYSDWSTAATNIQDAIDASTNGDTVLVTNGIYNNGGVVIAGGLTNRIALTNAITVQSVNGPWLTVIQGAGPIFTASAVRCAWLTNNATLTGFTLKLGSTRSGDPNGGGVLCASPSAVVENCVIVSNTATGIGAGVYGGTINNCLISSNTSGCSKAALTSCTIVSNNVGISQCSMTNCIDYYNANGNGSYQSSIYCCATPLPPGEGNFTNAPQFFADGVHLLSTSPCIGAGTNIVTGTDIFGQAWSNPPSVGCAEYNPAPILTPPSIKLAGSPFGFAVNVVAVGAPPPSFNWLLEGVPLQDNGHFTGTQTTNLVVTSVRLTDVGGYQVVASNTFGVITSAVATLTIHGVDAAGANPEPPYSTWATAATNIQDAINASAIGDIVLVTNGIYSSGAESEDGASTNRVTLDRAIRVQSVNGPWVTTIHGTGATNGVATVRCAWLTNNATLAGFTLTGGATQASGQTAAAEGGAVWCASSNGIVDNCVIISNNAMSRGVVYQGTLNNCLIISNNTYRQFGASANVIYGANLNSCTIVSNNSAGVSMSWMTNCILYYNSYGNYAAAEGAAFCCTTPAAAGTGNFTNAPDLQPDGVHLASGSPCIGAGTNLAIGTDIFGMAWANPPSVGCAEYSPLPTVSQPQIAFTASPVGFNVGNVAVGGQPPFSFFWLLNGAPVGTNGNFSSTQSSSLVVTGANLADAGGYQLVASNAFGMVTSAVAQLNIHAVDLTSTNPQPPFLTWATAATNIQDAIEAAAAGDIVLVTNGIYDAGGEVMAASLTNRVALDKALMVASVNGHKATVIQGAQDPVFRNGPAAVRCAWLTNGAILTGFTLQNGATGNTGDTMAVQSGGGAWCASTNALVSNCLLSNNFANYGGGGIAFGTLNNSLVILNVAASGGGAYNATLNNCTVQNNFTFSAAPGSGAGVYDGFIQNSIVVGNFDGYPEPFGLDNIALYDAGPPSIFYCCGDTHSGPLPAGHGNIDADPLFLDWYHISIYSPCRGAGSALYASGTDLDGEPWNNPPSIGCDEVVVADRVGPLSLTILPYETNVLVSSQSVLHVDSFWGTITGLATYLTWDFGDGPAITNADNTTQHHWTNTGDYNVVLTAFNVDNPSGVSATQVIHVVPVNPPQMQAPSISSNGIQFQITVQEGGNYFVQYATNLTPPVAWSNLHSIYDSFVSGPVQIMDSAPTNAEKFYRVVAQ